MIKTNFSNSKLIINKHEFNECYQRIKDELKHNYMFGWHQYLLANHDDLISEINQINTELQGYAKNMVVIGIGGSYLGSYAINEALNNGYHQEYQLIFLGQNLDSDYFNNVLAFCEENDFVLNVISKSGNTLEPSLAYELIKELMIKKYTYEGFKKRIIITTDAQEGCLRDECLKHDLKSLIINNDIGGRYSVFTSVGLLPLAFVNINIKELLLGAQAASKCYYTKDVNDAFYYALIRNNEYLNDKKVEALIVYNPYLRGLIEWYKQLFAESEGKNKKGLLPIGMVYSTDLHSLGQFVQEGTPMLFETNITFKSNNDISLKNFINNDALAYLSKYDLEDVNKIVNSSVIKAHYEIGNINNYVLALNELNEYNLAYLMTFMMYSCAYSASLLAVDPFNQPGVEVYKKEIKELL